MTLDPIPTLPTELVVVGEDRNDPRRLLLLGDDGLYYAWSLLDDATAPVEPDHRWRLTTPLPAEFQPAAGSWPGADQDQRTRTESGSRRGGLAILGR